MESPSYVYNRIHSPRCVFRKQETAIVDHKTQSQIHNGSLVDFVQQTKRLFICCSFAKIRHRRKEEEKKKIIKQNPLYLAKDMKSGKFRSVSEK